MELPMLDPTRNWECPSCHLQHVTREPRPHSPMHPCPQQKGIVVPLVEVHSNEGIARGVVRHVLVEREDFVNGEKGLRYDQGGRAIMAVRTERADGSNDCHAFAGLAVASSKAGD